MNVGYDLIGRFSPTRLIIYLHTHRSIYVSRLKDQLKRLKIVINYSHIYYFKKRIYNFYSKNKLIPRTIKAFTRRTRFASHGRDTQRPYQYYYHDKNILPKIKLICIHKTSHRITILQIIVFFCGKNKKNTNEKKQKEKPRQI